MADGEPTNSGANNTNPEGGATPPAPDAGGTTPPADPKAGEGTVDLSQLSGDELEKVLENKNLWNLPRIKELRDQAAEAKKLRDANAKADEDKLEANKEFEELAKKREGEVTTLKGEIQTMQINQALTSKLVGEGVVDLDGALKLADRSKITVNEDGSVENIDEALNSLKTDRPYLFKPGNNPVGTPTNPNNGGSQTPPAGGQTFKRSQITPSFYAENKEAIDKAAANGQIEDDGPAPTH